MNRLCLLAVMALAAVSLAAGQTRNPANASPVQRTNRSARVTEGGVRWRTVRIDRWGVDSLSVPAGLTREAESTEPHKNGDVSWTNYSRSWERPPNLQARAQFEVDFSVTSWDVDFAKGLGLSPEVATPERILAVELTGSLRRKESGEEPIEEASALEVGGLAGNFFRGKFGEGDTHVMVGWYTYRFYQNNAQRVAITVICPRTDLENSIRIIRSLKFR